MGRAGMAVYRPMAGVEVVSIDRTETTSMLSTHYAFGIPGPAWRHRVARKARYRGRVVEVPGSALVQVAPGEVVTAAGELDEKPPAHMISIEPAVVTAALRLPRPPELARFLGDGPDVIEAFTAFATSVEGGADPVEHEARFHHFIELAFRHADDRPPRPFARSCARAVARTQEVIRDRFAEPLSLDELARDVDLSVSHLARSFTELVGVPIHRYLQLVRCERAMEQLRRGAAIVDVAASCGFADQPHLNRVFRAIWGLTPGPFARPIDSRKNVQARARAVDGTSHPRSAR